MAFNSLKLAFNSTWPWILLTKHLISWNLLKTKSQWENLNFYLKRRHHQHHGRGAHLWLQWKRLGMSTLCFHKLSCTKTELNPKWKAWRKWIWTLVWNIRLKNAPEYKYKYQHIITFNSIFISKSLFAFLNSYNTICSYLRLYARWTCGWNCLAFRCTPCFFTTIAI